MSYLSMIFFTRVESFQSQEPILFEPIVVDETVIRMKVDLLVYSHIH